MLDAFKACSFEVPTQVCVRFFHPKGCPVVRTALNRTGLYSDVTNDCSVGRAVSHSLRLRHAFIFFCSPVCSVGPQAILITTEFGTQKNTIFTSNFLILFNFSRCRMILTATFSVILSFKMGIHFRNGESLDICVLLSC